MEEELSPNSVVTNPEAIEPAEYFQVLKSKLQTSEEEKLKAQLDIIAGHIIKARDIGQKSFIDKLSFTYDVIIKEQVLLASGIKNYVYQEDVKQFLDNIKTIKIIELERYPRAIPVANLEAIKKAQDLNIFDEYCVVFTDLTEGDYKTPAEKEYVARNRDPVVLGYFKHKNSGIKHDRFYLVTDWEDEYCDLTFSKMIEKMADTGINEPGREIGTDHKYVSEIVRATLEEMNNKKVGFSVSDVVTIQAKGFEASTEQKSFWERLKCLLKK